MSFASTSALARLPLKHGILFRAPLEEAECLDRDDTTETDEIGKIEAEVDQMCRREM